MSCHRTRRRRASDVHVWPIRQAGTSVPGTAAPREPRPPSWLSVAARMRTIGSGGSRSRLSRCCMGLGHTEPSGGRTALASPSAAAVFDGRKRTSHSPPSSSLASCAKPFDSSTSSSGVGLNVVNSRSPSPGASAATVSMIFSNGSPPARSIGRTSKSTIVVMIKPASFVVKSFVKTKAAATVCAPPSECGRLC